MAKIYKLINENTVYHTQKHISIPYNSKNRLYKEYLDWVAAGNTPDPVRTEQEEVAIQVEMIKRKADQDSEAIAPLREQVAMLAEYVELLEAKVDGVAYNQSRKDELKSKKDQIKAIRDKAAQDT